MADTVDLHLAYTGAPGTISVAAEPSTPSGWRSTVPLSPTTTISAGRYSQTTTLALAPLEAKARAGAAATGIPTSIAAGRPHVDVTKIATMVRPAERYGLLMLSWTRSGVATFPVQDENTTYRYRTCTTTSSPSEHVGIDA